jgi:hypothetical protein
MGKLPLIPSMSVQLLASSNPGAHWRVVDAMAVTHVVRASLAPHHAASHVEPHAPQARAAAAFNDAVIN